MEGPINDVLICTLTDDVTEKPSRRLLGPNALGSAWRSPRGKGCEVKVYAIGNLIASVRVLREQVCSLFLVKDKVEVRELEAKL